LTFRFMVGFGRPGMKFLSKVGEHYTAPETGVQAQA
jgi:hypothetical protein